MSLEISILCLEKELVFREVVEEFLLKNGFKVKTHPSFEMAQKLTSPAEYDIIIAHVALEEYDPLSKYCKRNKIPLVLAPSSKMIYRIFGEEAMIHIGKTPILTGRCYLNLKPKDLAPYLKE